MVNSHPFYIASGSPSLTLSDFVVKLIDQENLPYGEISTPSLALENLATNLGDGWYRLTNLPDTDIKKILFVALVGDPSTFVYQEAIDGAILDLRSLLSLFEVPPGNVPVTFSVTDAITLNPLAGVQISVWNSDLSAAVIPLITTNGGGLAKYALAPGTYNIFYVKPFVQFLLQPQVVVIAPGSTSELFEKTGTVINIDPVSLTRVTVFGWALNADSSPLVGAEVKLRVSAPQGRDSVNIGRGDVITKTDNTGYFELHPVAGLQVVLECPATGYSRRGTLPSSGAINWNMFAIATLS